MRQALCQRGLRAAMCLFTVAIGWLVLSSAGCRPARPRGGGLRQARPVSQPGAGRRGHDSARPPGRRDLQRSRHRRDPQGHSRSGLAAQAFARLAHAQADGHRHGISPRRVVPGVHVQAGADDVGRRAAERRQDGTQAHLVHDLSRARTPADTCSPTRQDDGTYVLKTVDRDVRFFPTFVLEAQEYNKAYLDRIIPTAIQAIQQKEDPNRKLGNSVGGEQQADPGQLANWSTTASGAWRPGKTSTRGSTTSRSPSKG